MVFGPPPLAGAADRYSLDFNFKLSGLKGLGGKPIDPDDAPATEDDPYQTAVGLAKGHLRAESWIDATVELERAIGIRETAGAYAMLGLAQQMAGDVRQATTSLEAAANLADVGSRHKLHKMIALMLYKQNRDDDALAMLEAALADAPSDPHLWACRVMCLSSTYQHEAAAEAAEQVLRLAPDDTTLLIPATGALLRAKHLDRCLEVTASACERRPDDTAVADMRVRCLYKCRDRTEVLPLLLPAARHYCDLTDRQSGEALRLLGDALCVNGRIDEALATYREALPHLEQPKLGEVETLMGRLDSTD